MNANDEKCARALSREMRLPWFIFQSLARSLNQPALRKGRALSPLVMTSRSAPSNICSCRTNKPPAKKIKCGLIITNVSLHLHRHGLIKHLKLNKWRQYVRLSKIVISIWRDEALMPIRQILLKPL